jgi:lysophospholipase L1-like esterase
MQYRPSDHGGTVLNDAFSSSDRSQDAKSDHPEGDGSDQGLSSQISEDPRVVRSPCEGNGHWVTVWATMPQWTVPDNMPPLPFVSRPPYCHASYSFRPNHQRSPKSKCTLSNHLQIQNSPNKTFYNATIRQTIRVTTGGSHIRLRISNVFGVEDLTITALTIALPKQTMLPNGTAGFFSGSKDILPNTIKALSFSGENSTIIPPGALTVSDSLDFPILSGQVITVNIYLRNGATGGAITSHPGSRTESWISRGDHTLTASLPKSCDEEPDIETASTLHWYFISALEAYLPMSHSSFALIGDSITDGRCSTDNGNDRWPDLFFNRAQTHTFARRISILNLAAGGNRILTHELGPNVLSRLDRDVFAQSAVKYVLVFHGVNDIGTGGPEASAQKILGDRLVQAYKQIVARTHAFGIAVFAATIGPFFGPDVKVQPYAMVEAEKTRQRVNEWIRTSGLFDAVVDFDAVLRNPKDSSRLRPEFDSGDYLHPTVPAFRAMADAFPLNIFETFEGRVSSR